MGLEQVYQSDLACTRVWPTPEVTCPHIAISRQVPAQLIDKPRGSHAVTFIVVITPKPIGPPTIFLRPRTAAGKLGLKNQ